MRRAIRDFHDTWHDAPLEGMFCGVISLFAILGAVTGMAIVFVAMPMSLFGIVPTVVGWVVVVVMARVIYRWLAT